MSVTIGPCARCDGTGRATSEFWRRREPMIGEKHVPYQDDRHAYSLAGLLFVDGKCGSCGGVGAGLVPARVAP